MPHALSRTNRFVARLFAFFAGLSMFVVFAIILANSTLRYTIGTSIQWGAKLPIYLTIYGVMFGMALAYLQDRHIRFTLVVDLISARIRHMLFLLSDVVVVVTGILLAYSGWQFADRGGRLSASSLRGASRWLVDMTGIDALRTFGTLYPYQIALAIGGVLLALAALLKFLERIASNRQSEDPAVSEMSETQL